VRRVINLHRSLSRVNAVLQILKKTEFVSKTSENPVFNFMKIRPA